jgi:hypothetical protein
MVKLVKACAFLLTQIAGGQGVHFCLAKADDAPEGAYRLGDTPTPGETWVLTVQTGEKPARATHFVGFWGAPE